MKYTIKTSLTIETAYTNAGQPVCLNRNPRPPSSLYGSGIFCLQLVHVKMSNTIADPLPLVRMNTTCVSSTATSPLMGNPCAAINRKRISIETHNFRVSKSHVGLTKFRTNSRRSIQIEYSGEKVTLLTLTVLFCVPIFCYC